MEMEIITILHKLLQNSKHCSDRSYNDLGLSSDNFVVESLQSNLNRQRTC